MPNQPTCTDCNQELELGFIPDASYATVFQTHWHPGTPEDSRFLGMKMPSAIGKEVPNIKHDSTVMVPVKAYRCPGCGVLKFFAEKAE